MKLIYLKNFRKGFATNSSSTHSLIYKNKDDMFKDLNVFELNYYDRFDKTMAVTREAKIKYICSQIFYDSFLLEVMCKYYPEMEQYIPLIKKQKEEFEKAYNDPTRDDNVFGSYARGEITLSGHDNLEFNIKYLKEIIENDQIVIVGGSDEEGWVYDVCEGHEPVNDISDVDTKYNVVKNGNYWVGHNRWKGNRIRFNFDGNECIPQYPELIDLKITNKCDHGCKFCYMGSNMKGKHADIKDLKSIIYSLSSPYKGSNKRQIEFAIGGGNVLLYPELEELFKYMKENGHIINTTINVHDLDKIYDDERFHRIFNNYVNGVGVSISNEEEVELLKGRDAYKFENLKFTLHLIPEMLGVKATRNIINKARHYKFYTDVLLLGYKSNNRGASITPQKFTDKELHDLFNELYCVGIDTTFANTYKKWISTNFDTENTVTWNEGEYSMYIDAVTQNAYKSSYQLDKPYNLKYMGYDKRDEWYSAIEAFNHIRQDNGFKAYE